MPETKFRRQLVEVIAEDPDVLLEADEIWVGPERDVKGYHVLAGGAHADQPGTLIVYAGREPGATLIALVFNTAPDVILGGHSVQITNGQVIPMPFLVVGFQNTSQVTQKFFDLYVEVRQTS